MNQIKEMSMGEFIRRFKSLIEEHEDSRFIFFLGAGCSVSSGIPHAKTLVKDWLPRLKKLKMGCGDNCDSWINGIYPDYTEDKASLLYGKVIEDLFLTSKDKKLQRKSLKEIKNLLIEKIRSPGWNLSDNVERAIKDGHPHPDFLEKLSKVISDEIDIQELDGFEFWHK